MKFRSVATKARWWAVVVGVVVLTLAVASRAENGPTSWAKARQQVLGSYEFTFYCGCLIKPGQGSKDRVDLRSCGYKSDSPIANDFDVEHIIPVSRLVAGRLCAVQRERFPQCVSGDKVLSARDCCMRSDSVARKAMLDPRNLRLAISEVNRRRGSRDFGIVLGEDREYGSCDLEFSSGVIEPAEDVRGDIARVYFYMLETYGFRTTQAEVALMSLWRLVYP